MTIESARGMYSGQDQEAQSRSQEGRGHDRGIRTRETRAERVGTRGGKMSEALKFGEREAASARKTLRSDQ